MVPGMSREEEMGRKAKKDTAAQSLQEKERGAVPINRPPLPRGRQNFINRHDLLHLPFLFWPPSLLFIKTVGGRLLLNIALGVKPIIVLPETFSELWIVKNLDT
ncbi:hypothetical protein J6590_033930 [Homalodisca vitripennis]|nr:hypothetical protein J6590_033930 [Homalodisca vitripennis]